MKMTESEGRLKCPKCADGGNPAIALKSEEGKEYNGLQCLKCGHWITPLKRDRLAERTLALADEVMEGMEMGNEPPFADLVTARRDVTTRLETAEARAKRYRSLLILVALTWFALALVTVFRERAHAEELRTLKANHAGELKLRDSVHRMNDARRDFDRAK